MELPGNSLLQASRNADVAETASTNVRITESQLSGRDATTQALAYRLRGVPYNRDIKELVKRALMFGDDIRFKVMSVADDPSRYGMRIATLEFSNTPGSLSQQTDNSEWTFSISVNGENITLFFDTHFRGLTPLHSSSDHECIIDLVAVSGLGGHAFGSFKERKGSYMWLRDSLAHDMPYMRIFIYGYDTQLEGSTSFANLDDLANEFQERVKSIRNYPRHRTSGISTTNPERPLIFIGHSLGGIIIKAANFKSIRGMLFFGVPNKGMPVSHWIPMVEGQPNRFFIEQLRPTSDILRAIRNDFCRVFTFRSSKIYSFYETKESPTAQKGNDGKWKLKGPSIQLVDIGSATQGRSWEERGNYIKPIHRTHSELVKFRQIDDDYTTVELLEESPKSWLEKIPTDVLWAALMAILTNEPERELLVVIDGLGAVQDEKDEFAKSIRELVDYLQQQILNMKALFTSRPQANIREIFDGLPQIEHDKERRECRASLYFDNSRYGKIEDQYEGSLEWIWTHDQYKEWSKPNASRFLYLQGKPGSGKSTLARYLREKLSKQDPEAHSSIVAKFFYSDRDGELQSSHYNMLRCILYEILGQNEASFYHSFQSEYRRILKKQGIGRPVEWNYESLKKILLSISDVPPAKRVYLIIDALDESDDVNRREILDLMLNLCSESKNCAIKIFLASRPIGVLEKKHVSEFSDSKFLSIELQDHTKSDIAKFADSFLKKLDFRNFLEEATDYIVKNAQGVFLWVQLVQKELQIYDDAGRCEKDVFDFLMSLPTELENFYKRMLDKMGRNKTDIRDGIRMFQLVLFACRPLTTDELLHALGIPGELDAEFTIPHNSFRSNIPSKRRITHCGGNFLEIRPYFGNAAFQGPTMATTKANEAAGRSIVQLMHQTVREIFLRPGGIVAASDFRMSEKDAHICISVTCIRYLIFCAANMAERLPNTNSWTQQHLKDCAQCLEEMPFVTYALRYLNHHIDSCQQDADVLRIASKSIDEIMNTPAAYLLGNWVTSHLNNNTISKDKLSGAETDLPNRTLYFAVKEGYLIAAEVSLIIGADVNGKAEEARAPLHHAAANGHEAVVRLLFDKGADLECRDGNGQTPLHHAAEKGYEAVVRLLLDIGADLKPKDNLGRTPLLWTAANGNKSLVKLLLNSGDNLRSKDNLGRTSLSWAAGNGHKSVVKLLLNKGGSLKSKDNLGCTPLHYSVEYGHVEIVRLLINHGASLKSKDNLGKTPLHYAAGNGHEEAVKLLLDSGANPMSKDDIGRTSMSWAAMNNHMAVARLLRYRGTYKRPESYLSQTPLAIRRS
ncbi:Ankyrin repeat domain-containing protein 50 [Trichoderma lentiforme]|uniref:Ankyrin repeat domain-containing protein 50 n=1 Tax=Trichoderma lentiforme TaxID=1567552 RepID=A0A9P4X8U0_9HYPO|nr:Ankyrin repeat domain-containing protein 50 [Trichoderma lentiforme]